jgi:epoxyqueuosine reductase
MTAVDLAAAIKDKAMELGLDAVGITDASPVEPAQAQALRDWLGSGLAGPMAFMHRHVEKRIDPGQLLPGARSVVAVGLNYKPRVASLLPPGARMGRVACYALYEDYHGFLRARLRELASFIRSLTGKAIACKVCVDSIPLLERALAHRAGLGFIARNHMLIHPRLGPQLFLGELVTTLDLPPEAPAAGDCGHCDHCIRACPTGALKADGFLDARRCINTLTIEHPGDIPGDLASQIGVRLYGCDECVLACPFQAKAPACRNAAFRFHPDRAWLNLYEVLAMNQEGFATRFSNSPILRIGLDRLQRNARVCLRNEANEK